jgi:hypothetical protein
MVLKKLFCLILIIAAFTAKTQNGFQEGYIVHINGDTLKGFVDFKSTFANEKSCAFKSDLNASVETYGPNQILAYGFFKGWIYRSNQFGMDLEKLSPSFVRIVVDGDVQLFWFQGKYFMRSSKSSYTYILNKDGRDYIRVLSAVLVNDCFELASDVSNVSLTDESLLKLFRKYYECVDKNFTKFTRPKPRPHIGIGFESSQRTITSQSVDFEDFNQATKSYGFTIKAIFNQSIKPYSKFSIQLEGGYSLENYYLINYEGDNNYETRFSYSSVILSANLKYAHPLNETLTIHGQIGAGGYFIADSNQSRLVEEQIGNNIFINEFDDSFVVTGQQIFLDQRIGLEYRLGAKKVFIEAFNRLSLTDPVVASNELTGSKIKSSYNEMGVGVGVLFPLPPRRTF